MSVLSVGGVHLFVLLKFARLLNLTSFTIDNQLAIEAIEDGQTKKRNSSEFMNVWQIVELRRRKKFPRLSA